MNKDYQLPSQKDEAKRSRNEVEIEYGLFSMNDQLEELGKNKKYYIRTYGCQANVRDGESIAGMMEVMGFTNTEDTAEKPMY